jgi:hypothetical protein
LSPEERQDYLKEKQSARKAVQKKIRDVSAKREAYLKAERAKRSGGKASLDDAMRTALRQQAEQRGFEFDDPAAEPAQSDASGQ